MEINGLALEHSTIGDLVAAQVAGQTTARQLVQAYLDRIAGLDQTGPALNAVVTIADGALRRAGELDRALAVSGPVGPLHGVPVVVKDNLETADMPTSFGSELFADYQADRDASAVAALRSAGAIVIAKTSLPDWATSWFGHSSRTGVTRNPFDLERDPGGSSAGTAAAVAAAYAAAGLGTDCGGSVRLPSSLCNLVGVRPTPGLTSRAGSSPLVGAQDTVGPMTRTVEDAARLLDVIAGFDAADPLTATYSTTHHLRPGSFRGCLVPDALVGRRLGVLRSAFGSDSDIEAAPVNEVMRGALRQLVAGGAELIDVTIDDLRGWIERTSMYTLASKRDLNAWLAQRPKGPAGSVAEIIGSGRYDSRLDLLEAIAAGPEDPLSERVYIEAYLAREAFSRLLVGMMEVQGLSGLVYPTCQVLAPRRSDIEAGKWTTLNFPTNTVIGSQSWLPSITVPAGLAAGQVPVGLEILTRPHAEHTMFGLAYAFERVRVHRTLPSVAA
ncbi:amidase [Amycolatopsis sp. RTGN1]|uniref:amidase n=1 Tax=Amycolatopsis ponsaeliensis TaxID=2992142 RepID=UPI00254B26AA|nr:amidase [Amycolatopsis sp. RTGN1]